MAAVAIAVVTIWLLSIGCPTRESPPLIALLDPTRLTSVVLIDAIGIEVLGCDTKLHCVAVGTLERRT